MTMQDPLGAPTPHSVPSWAAEPTNGGPPRQESWSGEPEQAESWADMTRSDPEATQAWIVPQEPEPEGTPEPPPPVPAWAAAPLPAPSAPLSAPPPSPPSSSGPAEAAEESIVPDSWFAPSRGQDLYEEPTERWTPQPPHVQSSPDPWAPGGQGAAGWPAQPPPPPPPPHNQTTILDSAFPESTMHLPGGPGGPPGPGPLGPGGSRHRQPGSRDNKPLLIAVAALVAIAVVAVGIVLWTQGDGTAAAKSSSEPPPKKASQTEPKPSGPSQKQARAVHQLFVASADTRNALGRALIAAKKCETLPAAIEGFQRVAQRRTNQINRTKALQVGALKRGERLRAALLRSFQLSLQVDQAFLAWAQGAQGCTGVTKHDANYANGVALSSQATVAKKQVSTLWNPVARKEKLQTRTDRQF